MEISILKDLDSEYTPKIFNVFITSSKLYLQMENAGIMTLKQFLSNEEYQNKVYF